MTDTAEVTKAKKSPAKKAAKKAVKKVAAKATKKAAKAVESEGRKGRPSQFSGMKLKKLVKDNPRREGTHGFNSFAVITNGMTYEQYIDAGGRLNDLVWDVEKGHVEVK